MSLRELVILGTSAQVPTRDRNHNGYFLRWDGVGILFDPGEGTQRQMTYAEVASSCITHIALTHFHGDHCLGFPGVVQRLSLDQVTHDVHTFYPASGESFYQAMLRSSMYQNRVNLVAHPTTEGGLVFETGDFRLTTLKLEHRAESWGYRFEELATRTIDMDKLRARGIKGPIVGQLKRDGFLDTPEGRIELDDVSVHRPGQSFAIIMDTRPCENAYILAKDVDILLCESTYLNSEAREANAYMHMTVGQAAALARDAGAKKLVLTHFSQRYMGTNDFAIQAREVFHPTHVARDLDRIGFPKRKRDL